MGFVVCVDVFLWGWVAFVSPRFATEYRHRLVGCH